ncbi:hypothetical protein IAE50_24415 [Kosakonia sp. S42]|nr:hypothetical protein [Kosakonia sp. S42]
MYWYFKDKNELLSHVIQSFRWLLITEFKELSCSECSSILKNGVVLPINRTCIFNECSDDFFMKLYGA